MLQIVVFKDLGSLGGRISVKVLLTWLCFSVVRNFGVGRKAGECYFSKSVLGDVNFIFAVT